MILDRWLFRLCFHGASWWGWQRQSQGPTIQSAIEQELSALEGRVVKVTACSRTDRGVHARYFYFHADLSKKPYSWLRALNARLPASVRILDAIQVPSDFCANRSAVAKLYHYYVYVSRTSIPWLEPFALHLRVLPLVKVLQESMLLFEGTHDFRAFQARGASVKTTVRTIFEARFQASQENSPLFQGPYELFFFRLKGSGFLKQMVRALVGTCLDRAMGRRSRADIEAALSKGDRTRVGKTLPPHGLWLEEVFYPLDWPT